MRSISAHIRNRSQPLTAWANTLPSAELCVGRQSAAAHSRSTSPNGSASIASLNANFGKLARAPAMTRASLARRGRTARGLCFVGPLQNSERPWEFMAFFSEQVGNHGLTFTNHLLPLVAVLANRGSWTARYAPFRSGDGCLLVPGLWEAARVGAVLDCCLKHRGRKIGKGTRSPPGKPL